MDAVVSTGAETTLAWLLTRRSVSPRRLAGPGPGPVELALMLQAALRAPDHGGLHPWRVIEFGAAQRNALADLFEEEKRRRDPLASADDLRRSREHAIRPPTLLAFVVSLHPRSGIPVREQWLAAGAALGNLLNAAHLQGHGAIALSGERCFDNVLVSRLGLRREEHLAAFISIGRIVDAPPARAPARPSEVHSHWVPAERKAPVIRAEK
jgi:nitroreductase